MKYKVGLIAILFLNSLICDNTHFTVLEEVSIPKSESYTLSIQQPTHITSTSYIEHDPIEILTDDDFQLYGFPGEGTEEEPYIIANYNITTGYYLGIYVFNTTKHFTIENCYIDADQYGIAIEKAAPNTVTINDNKCFNHIESGIYFTRSHNVTAQSNECYNNNIGILVTYSHNTVIIDNFCTYNEYGIGLLYSDYAVITENICAYNTWGIALLVSKFYTINENILFQNFKGMEVNQSNNGTISNNNVEGCIEGIKTVYCSSILITKNDCLFNTLAISCHDSDLITASENECYSNIGNGIYMDDTADSRILRNFCYNNTWSGISTTVCENMLIAENNCTENGYDGIRAFYGDFKFVPPITIINNFCKGNNMGIGLYTAYYGLVANNTCIANTRGIFLTESYYNTISSNIIKENIKYGINVDDDSVGNIFYQNDFINNNLEGTEQGNAQAFDSGVVNKWYNEETSTGNYWSDLQEGGEEYLLDGDAGATDPFPLTEPVHQTNPETTEEMTEESPIDVVIFIISLIGLSSQFNSFYKKRK